MKFKITKEDEAFMNSIGAKHKAIKVRIRTARKQGVTHPLKGRSHISGNIYSHDY